MVNIILIVTHVTVREVTRVLMKDLSKVMCLHNIASTARHPPDTVVKSGKGTAPSACLQAWWWVMVSDGEGKGRKMSWQSIKSLPVKMWPQQFSTFVLYIHSTGTQGLI